MKRVWPGFFLLLLLSGCFETNFNFKTVVHRNGRIDREVQINGRGADRFLPPSGPQWKVISSESKGGQSILADTHYHIHAVGHFADPNQLTGDFHYDTPKLISNLTDQTRQEFRDELKIPEPFDQEIGAANRIELNRKKGLLSTQYDYAETFEIRWLIPILIHDLKKEVVRERATSLKAEGGTQAPAGAASSPPLAPGKVEELARQKLVEDILPKFQFHSEITLPGKILSTNATAVHGRTALWDFRATDFEDDFSRYVIHVSSRSPNISVIMTLVLVLLGVIALGIFVRPRRR